MFEQLTEKFQALVKNLRGQGSISESNVTDACKQIRMALLEADVNFAVARELVDVVRTRALGAEVLQAVAPGQQFIKIFHDALVELFGPPVPLVAGTNQRILLCGLQGSGKTTTAGKLALYLKKKQGRSPLLVAADLQRPAAITQLESLGQQLGVPVHSRHGATDPLPLVQEALERAQREFCNSVIVDTAGRLDIDDALLAQLRDVAHITKPHEILFVADAALGQKAVDVVMRFKETVPLTGIILTRLDGDAPGGAALSMRHVTGLPIKFLGTGEKPDQLEPLDGDRLAGRILGMGDVVGLVEKAQEAFDEDSAANLEEKLRKNSLDLQDFLSQLRMMKKLGPVENLLGMIPGAPKLPNGSQVEKRLRQTEAIILSMTPEERRKPEVLNARRRQRVARGSGTTVAQVNELLLQFNTMRKMMRDSGKMKKLLSRFGG
jgi:signal recognition particle subunit SRP54